MVRKGLVTALVLLAAPTGASAAEPAGTYNAPGQTHNHACVSLATSPALLRFADGQPTGFALSDALSFFDGRCAAGQVRADFHEVFPSVAAGPLVFHRGGHGYDDAQNVKYGQLASADIAGSLGEPRPSGGGRGAPCTLSSDPPQRIEVTAIPRRMKYKRPQDVPSGNNTGASFLHYGDPGADQGDRGDIHYTYLLWSFVDVRGGGMVRTLLGPGQIVRLCDVEPVTANSWDRHGELNGSVTARYVRALAGSCPVYGWTVWSHAYLPTGGVPVAHTSPVDTAPAPEPAPDPDCPVAGPAVAPTVEAADATVHGDTSATLAGRVNPEGLPTSYRFEYGPGGEYGAATADAPVPSPAVRPNTVTGEVGDLQPGTTYRYRLAATNAQGTSYSPERSFTTTAPAAAALPKPPLVKRLRLAPGRFRRARARRGRTSRIRLRTSRRATVTMTFLRRTAGRRARGKCRRVPARRVPRGRRRCALWVRARGSLRKPASRKLKRIRFGGWVRRRPLARGTYRLRAVATDARGQVGPARHAVFRLR